MFELIKNEFEAIYFVAAGIVILFIGGVMSDSVTNLVDRFFKR
jgi:hypothetical protein